MKTVSATVELKSSTGDLWKAITNHEELRRHVSMLREVKVLESRSAGVGTIRKCTLTSGKAFHENVTVWEEGRSPLRGDLLRSPELPEEKRVLVRQLRLQL